MWSVNYAKPVISREPASQKALRFGNVTMVCEAASSSESTLTISWKKDNQVHRQFTLSVHIILGLLTQSYLSPDTSEFT